MKLTEPNGIKRPSIVNNPFDSEHVHDSEIIKLEKQLNRGSLDRNLVDLGSVGKNSQEKDNECSISNGKGSFDMIRKVIDSKKNNADGNYGNQVDTKKLAFVAEKNLSKRML